MATSEILLLKPVEGLGGEGDQVKVRAGYARNFLLPGGFAAPLTASNRKRVDALKKRRAERETQELGGAHELAKQGSFPEPAESHGACPRGGKVSSGEGCRGR